MINVALTIAIIAGVVFFALGPMVSQKKNTETSSNLLAPQKQQNNDAQKPQAQNSQTQSNISPNTPQQGESQAENQYQAQSAGAETQVEFGIKKPEAFGMIVESIHNNIATGTTEAIEILNLGIEDAVYVTTRMGDEVVKYNIERYKVDEAANKIYLKVRNNENISRWIAVTKSGHEKLLRFLENALK